MTSYKIYNNKIIITREQKVDIAEEGGYTGNTPGNILYTALQINVGNIQECIITTLILRPEIISTSRCVLSTPPEGDFTTINSHFLLEF